MWKRFGAICSSFFFIIMMFGGVGVAWATCDLEPPDTPGGWTWPIQGTLTNSWSYDCHADRGHRGIDISAASDTTIRAAASGTVAFVGYTPAEGGGITVTIDHPGGLRSTYLHFSQTSVSKGQSVSGGDPIGASDDGVLHFGIKVPISGHDIYYDPLGFLPPLPEAGEPAPTEVQTGTITGAPATELTLITDPEPVMEPVTETGTAVLPDQPLETLPSTVTQPADASATPGTVVDITSPIPIETTSSNHVTFETPATEPLSIAAGLQTASTNSPQTPATVHEPETGESFNQPTINIASDGNLQMTEAVAKSSAPAPVPGIPEDISKDAEGVTAAGALRSVSPDTWPWPLLASATLDRVMAPIDKKSPSWRTVRAMYMQNPVNRLAVATALLLVSLIAGAGVRLVNDADASEEPVIAL